MKIAAVTENGTQISKHFGRARQFLVFTVEDGKVVEQELRDKDACDDNPHEHDTHVSQDTLQSGVSIEVGIASDLDPHQQAVAIIADCDAVLAGGMGQGMYTNLQRVDVRPVLTRVGSIEEALTAYLEGRLKEYPDLVH